MEEALSALTPRRQGTCARSVEELSRPEARDPKLAAVRYFLTEHRTEGKTWLEHGCIVFSQYYDTYSLGRSWRSRCPANLWASMQVRARAGLFRGEDFASVEREDIKKAVKRQGHSACSSPLTRPVKA